MRAVVKATSLPSGEMPRSTIGAVRAGLLVLPPASSVSLRSRLHARQPVAHVDDVQVVGEFAGLPVLRRWRLRARCARNATVHAVGAEARQVVVGAPPRPEPRYLAAASGACRTAPGTGRRASPARSGFPPRSPTHAGLAGSEPPVTRRVGAPCGRRRSAATAARCSSARCARFTCERCLPAPTCWPIQATVEPSALIEAPADGAGKVPSPGSRRRRRRRRLLALRGRSGSTRRARALAAASRRALTNCRALTRLRCALHRSVSAPPPGRRGVCRGSRGPMWPWSRTRPGGRLALSAERPLATAPSEFLRIACSEP